MLAVNLISNFIGGHRSLMVAAGVAVVGLLGLGLRDVLRFSFKRVWAVSTVCFQQAIRRKVLWVTPLAMVGVVAVSQFQKSIDAQDVIRQTTTYCLFATGMVVMLLTVLLASTNLPRDIETRVIYTIATKPITRLELVLGKVIGFVRVSFCVLLIMGAFSYAYLHLRDWQQRQASAEKLTNLDPLNEISRPSLTYARDHGALHARELVMPAGLSVVTHVPTGADDRWIPGFQEGLMLAPFLLDKTKIPEPERVADLSLPQDPGGVVLRVKIRSKRVPAPVPLWPPPTTTPTTQPVMPPTVIIDLRNSDGEVLVTPQEWNAPPAFRLAEGGGEIRLPIPAMVLSRWLPENINPAPVFVGLSAYDDQHDYSTSSGDWWLETPDGSRRFSPSGEINFAGRLGRYGQMLKGRMEGSPTVGIYHFRNVQADAGRESYPFELKVGVDTAREETDATTLTRVAIEFRNLATGKTFATSVTPESTRPIYLDVPAEVLKGPSPGAAGALGGDFDVVLRVYGEGWVGLVSGPGASLRMVNSDQSFAWNLVKSLTVLWLMSLLVTIVSIFCSTFVSWPIAVVLTLVILTGRWGAEQLADVTSPGLGRSLVDDLFRGGSAVTARAVSESVDALVKGLNLVAVVLPDIARFSAVEEIQQGVAVSPATILGSLEVALGFGVPLIVLAYIFLKFKEVAP